MKRNYFVYALFALILAPGFVFADPSDAQDAKFMQDKSDSRFKDDLAEAKGIKKECPACGMLGLSPTFVAAIDANKKNQEAQVKGDADFGRKLMDEYKKDDGKGKPNVDKKADADYFSGDYASAIKIYSDQIANEKNVEGLYIKRGLAYAKSKDRARALADYEQAKKLVDPALFGYQLAELAAALGKFDEAAYYLGLRVAQEKKRDPGYVSQSQICPILELVGQDVSGCARKQHVDCAFTDPASPTYQTRGCPAIKLETDYLKRVGAVRGGKKI
jgi:tetratricopeptide (TPR) repeat protein